MELSESFKLFILITHKECKCKYTQASLLTQIQSGYFLPCWHSSKNVKHLIVGLAILTVWTKLWQGPSAFKYATMKFLLYLTTCSNVKTIYYQIRVFLEHIKNLKHYIHTTQQVLLDGRYNGTLTAFHFAFAIHFYYEHHCVSFVDQSYKAIIVANNILLILDAVKSAEHSNILSTTVTKCLYLASSFCSLWSIN